MWDLVNSAVTAALIVGFFMGIFLALRLSEIVLRREWRRLAIARKDVNDRRRAVERRWEQWRQLQGPPPGWHDPDEE